MPQNQTNRRVVFKLSEMGFSGFRDFGYYNYNSVEPELEVHSHQNVMEICYCLRGQQYYDLNGEMVKLKGNDILIVPANTNHSTGTYPEDIGALYWLQVIVDPKTTPLCHLSREHSKYLLTGLDKQSKRVFSGSRSLKATLLKLKNLLEQELDTLGKLNVSQLLIQILLDTLLLAKNPQLIVPTERVIALENYINENVNRMIYVDELANQVNLSTAYFKSWFKEKLGTSPRAYINRLKIEHAKTELLQAKSVTEVAYSLGFSSSQYFSTTFKKYVGKSPNAYRAEMSN